MLFVLCSIVRWPLRWLTSYTNNSLSLFYYTLWSSGCRISTLVWWTSQVLSKPLHPLLPNSLRRTRGRSSSTLIITYTLPPQYPTFVSGIFRLASYMSYISQDTAPPLIRKAVYAQRVMATKSKYNWWSNSWLILNNFKVQESDPTDPPPCVLKEEIRSQYRCWWLRKFANPDHSPKLRTFRLFKTSFGTSPYLDFGPYYLRPALLRFRCSNHRLDIELGRHTNVP